MSNAKEVIQDWKQNKGFPYYPEDRKWRDDEFKKLTSFNRDTLLDTKNKIIGQSTHGLTLAWSYMHHAWSIKCGKMKTPMEIWEDEEHLEKGINKILTGTFFTKREAHKITDSDMRAMLRRYSGTQMVSNFRPTAAATLYDIFVEKDSPLEGTEAGTVWDPSMGYGGRLMGAIAAGQDGGQWDELGSRIGEAFQVADDLRDALYSEGELGKPAGQDDLHGRPNAVAEYGIEGAISHMKNILGGAISSIPCCPGEAMLAKMVNAQAEMLTPMKWRSKHSNLHPGE